MLKNFKFILLLFFLSMLCGTAYSLNLTPVDKVVIMEISGETAYPTGKTHGIVKRLGKIRETGRQHCPIGGKGVAYLVEVYNDGVKRSFLCDTGNEGIILKHNFPYFHKNPDDLELIAITHGHSDHYGGINSVTEMMKADKVSILVGNEDAFNERFFSKKGKVNGVWTWDRSKNTKADFVITNGPKLILGNQVVFTGPVPRKFSYEGVKTPWRKKIGVKLVPDVMLEDSGIVINVKNKGLVVLSSCDHAGLVNTLTYAKKITGVDKIYAYMGSAQKVTDLKSFKNDLAKNKPFYFVSTHCAANKPKLLKVIKNIMGDKYDFSKVGSEFSFDSTYKD